MQSPGKILLTGATGFIGSHVMERLSRAGLAVVAMTRPASDVSFIRSHGVEIRHADLEHPASLAAVMEGCTQVIHTAALAADWGPEEAFRRVNVQGTLNLLQACKERAVDHIILTGSISSYGEEHSAKTKDENSASNSHYPYLLDRIFPSAFNFYRDSKAEMTRRAESFANEHHLNLTIIEPVWVYGEREFNTGFYGYVKAVQSGTSWIPGSRDNTFHVIYARDLAKAYLLAATRRLPGVEKVIVGNQSPAPMHRVFDLFCEHAGLRPPHRLPKWTTYPVGLGLELYHTLAGSTHPPLLTRGRVNMFYDSIRFSTARAARVLGFECDHSLEDGIRKTVAWYKANELL